MRAAAIVKDVRVIRRKLGGFVQRLSGILRLSLGELQHAEPHPGGWALRICSGLFLNRDNGFIRLIEPEQRHAEEQVCATELGFQDQRLLKTGNGFVEPFLLLEDQAKV